MRLVNESCVRTGRRVDARCVRAWAAHRAIHRRRRAESTRGRMGHAAPLQLGARTRAVCGAGGADAYLVIARDEVGEQLGYDRHDHIRVA